MSLWCRRQETIAIVCFDATSVEDNAMAAPPKLGTRKEIEPEEIGREEVTGMSDKDSSRTSGQRRRYYVGLSDIMRYARH